MKESPASPDPLQRKYLPQLSFVPCGTWWRLDSLPVVCYYAVFTFQTGATSVTIKTTAGHELGDGLTNSQKSKVSAKPLICLSHLVRVTPVDVIRW